MACCSLNAKAKDVWLAGDVWRVMSLAASRAVALLRRMEWVSARALSSG